VIEKSMKMRKQRFMQNGKTQYRIRILGERGALSNMGENKRAQETFFESDQEMRGMLAVGEGVTG
jgi:hypothetical protein